MLYGSLDDLSLYRLHTLVYLLMSVCCWLNCGIKLTVSLTLLELHPLNV